MNLFFQEAAEKTGKSAETCPPLWNLSLFTQIAQLAFLGQLTYVGERKRRLLEMEHVIPASEFTRNFGRYQMLAQREPVAVTSHGRTTGYFIAAEDYEAFKRFKESRRSFATVDLPEERARAISSSRMDERHAHLDTMLDE